MKNKGDKTSKPSEVTSYVKKATKKNKRNKNKPLPTIIIMKKTPPGITVLEICCYAYLREISVTLTKDNPMIYETCQIRKKVLGPT